MSAERKVDDLREELIKTRQMVAKIDAFYQEFVAGDFKRLGRSRLTGIGLAEIFDNFYTCLETFFVRVNQFYGNGLQDHRWHADLLHKMTLGIPDVREPVLRDETAAILQEFLKFRHFRRYYFEFEYDWDKLDYLLKKYEQVRAAVAADLDGFADFLKRLRDVSLEG